LLCGAASVGALAFARVPALLALFAFLAAATGDMYRPAMSAAVADVVPPADRPRAYGLVYWAVNLALSVGLVIGGLVAERSFVALFLADAGTSLAAAAIILFRVPETRPPGIVHEPALRGLLKVFADGPFFSFLLLHLAALAVFVQWQLALPIDMSAHGLRPSAHAVLMALNCARAVFLQPILSPRLGGVDAALLLALAATLLALGYVVNALGGTAAVASRAAVGRCWKLNAEPSGRATNRACRTRCWMSNLLGRIRRPRACRVDVNGGRLQSLLARLVLGFHDRV